LGCKFFFEFTTRKTLKSHTLAGGTLLFSHVMLLMTTC
jgi:hypothetical protein